MNASTAELILEIVPLLLLCIAVYKMLVSASFHNTKYLTRPEMDGRKSPTETRGRSGI